MNLSVIICTHNPRHDYLHRTLDALRAQTLPQEQWELLLIDNGSKEPLVGQWDLSWHPHARIIREEELGLTHARLRGIKESLGDLLVFVDDDNVLDRQYLQFALNLSKLFPHIGAFNGGTIGEYETNPPTYLKPYTDNLGKAYLKRNYWSNLEAWTSATPFGTGLCVIRSVAVYYANLVKSDPLRQSLDRCGQNLISGGDIDLVFCAIDQGMGTGRFMDLKLIHLIPSRRLTEEYIIQLYAGYAAAEEIHAAIRPHFYPKPQSAWKANIRFVLSCFRATRIQRRIMLASRQARRDARDLIRKINDQ